MSELNKKQWNKFDFSEIFYIQKGFYNKKPAASGEGTIPFLGATDSNNGVTTFLTYREIDESSKTGDNNNSPIEKKMFRGSAIAVTNNGSVGHAYYQATDFTCSHDINPLYLRDHKMNRAEADFLIKAIEEQGKLFQYARKWRPVRMVKSKIMLPVDSTGNPDYTYMEQYASEKRGGCSDAIGNLGSSGGCNTLDWRVLVWIRGRIVGFSKEWSIRLVQQCVWLGVLSTCGLFVVRG